jgi:hypothetical protein
LGNLLCRQPIDSMATFSSWYGWTVGDGTKSQLICLSIGITTEEWNYEFTLWFFFNPYRQDIHFSNSEGWYRTHQLLTGMSIARSCDAHWNMGFLVSQSRSDCESYPGAVNSKGGE